MTDTATTTSRKTRATKPGPWRIGDIIDGRSIRVKLSSAAHELMGDDRALRARALDILHQALFRGRMIAQERLELGSDGLDTARLLSAVQDEVLSALFDFTTTHVFRSRNPTEGERLAVFATGGYGRGVLAPSSDIDLLFVRAYKQTAWAESVIEYMLYMLWDIGLKVGHAFRTIDDCIRLSREDVTIKTSLLDARYLFGDAEIAGDLRLRFNKDVIQGHDAEFIAAKLAERDERHERMGSTRYVVEPNVKEGKGGLRDLQTLFWILKHIYGGDTLEEVMATGFIEPQERRAFLRAGRFFWTVRCYLHYMTGRGEDRLSFDLQPELARNFGYVDRGRRLGVERFMKRYFLVAKEVGTLTRILSARLEAIQKKKAGGRLGRLMAGGVKKLDEKGFCIDTGRISIESPDLFEREPIQMLRLFVLADRHETDVHPDAMTAAIRQLSNFQLSDREDPEAIKLFLEAATSYRDPANTLRLMNEAGILGRFLPEFGRIVAQTQFNMYHHYTVDEHTLRAVETMSDIEHGRISEHALPHRIFQQLQGRRAVYLAMLLHDTGKGRGDQQEEGARTARVAARRLGLPESEAEDIAWLVGHHLEMSETAQKRDITDARTVAKFAEVCGSLERLRMLYVLTVSDISAVGPGVWNAWKGQLLAELYHNTAAALRGGRANEANVRADLAVRARERRKAVIAATERLTETHDAMEDAYWAGFEVEELVWHAKVLKSQDDSEYVVKVRAREDGTGVAVLVSCPDRLGLFADLTGAMTAQAANIVSAQVFTSNTGRILDIFQLQDTTGRAYTYADDHRIKALEKALFSAARGGFDASKAEFPARRPNRREAAFLIDPSVEFDPASSADHLVIDVAGRDRPGLLFELARAISDMDLAIGSAHVGSYGERMFDAFYVRRPNGDNRLDEDTKTALKERLLAVLSREEPEAPSTPARSLRRARSAESF